MLLWISLGIVVISIAILVSPITDKTSLEVDDLLGISAGIGIIGIVISGITMLFFWIWPSPPSELINVSYSKIETHEIYSANTDNSSFISCFQESQKGVYKKQTYDSSDVTILREISPNPRIEVQSYTGQKGVWWLEPITFQKSGTVYRLYVPIENKGNFHVDEE